MATIIEQKPLYTQTPVGQDVIFVVSNSNIVSTKTRVKFQAEVHISNTFAPNTAVADDVVGKFKTTPNNAGVGIFNLRSVIENYVSADNMARINSTYKDETTTDDKRHPLHLIDKFSGNVNLMRYLVIQFKTEYFDTTTNELVQVEAVNSNLFQIFNGYLTYADILDVSGANFGFDMSDDFLLTNSKDKFLSNAPTIQYANVEDYGTVAMFTPKAFNDQLSDISYITLTYKNSAGVTIGTDQIDRTTANGAYDVFNAYIGMNVLYFGCFPGNLRNWSAAFKALVTAGTIQGGEIGIQVFTSAPTQIASSYTIKVNCPDLKGYESVRLCWLNQYGVWDYYTFTKKSTKSITTQGTTYNQLEGTWNESKYRIDSFKGGKKTFRVNSTERISMNTDYITESESIWLEELINSPEVYILKGQSGLNDETGFALNQFVTPVRLTTSSYTRKTIANDKLIQYTFEVEKTKTLRTQAI
tara:strand:+ start:821 stop:2233 length:1413 start_codon:yes stop_codon:yes gene_type:complete